jgi:cell division protein ZapA
MTKTVHTPKEEAAATLATSKVAITLHGREYVVTCGAGEEKKLSELVNFVNNKLDEVEANGPSVTETRLFMLACLLLADELIETRKAAAQNRKEDEALMVAAVNHLRDRVMSISEMVGKQT